MLPNKNSHNNNDDANSVSPILGEEIKKQPRKKMFIFILNFRSLFYNCNLNNLFIGLFRFN